MRHGVPQLKHAVYQRPTESLLSSIKRASRVVVILVWQLGLAKVGRLITLHGSSYSSEPNCCVSLLAEKQIEFNISTALVVVFEPCKGLSRILCVLVLYCLDKAEDGEDLD